MVDEPDDADALDLILVQPWTYLSHHMARRSIPPTPALLLGGLRILIVRSTEHAVRRVGLRYKALRGRLMHEGLSHLLIGDQHVTQPPEEGAANRLELISSPRHGDDQFAMLARHLTQVLGRYRDHTFGQTLKLVLSHQMPAAIERLVVDLPHDLHGLQFLRRDAIVLGNAAKPRRFRPHRSYPNQGDIDLVGFLVD